MMRLLMLTDRFPPEVRSAAHLFHELALALQRNGHEACVVTKIPTGYVADQGVEAESADERCEQVDGVKVRRVSGFFDRGSGKLLFRAADHLTLWLPFLIASRQHAEADVVLVYSPPLPLFLSGVFYRIFRHAGIVLNVQDLYPQTAVDLGLLKNPVAVQLAELLEWFAYRLVDHVVVHSEGNREFLLRKGLTPERVSVIPNWVDLESIRPGARENGYRQRHGLEGKFVISYAGVMGYAQDLGTVIEAARRLAAEPDVVFLLVGEGIMAKRWRQSVSDQQLDNVKFLPMEPKHRYPEVLAASDVCLVPLSGQLRTPVVPGKLQSIMAAGRPVLAILNLDGDASRIVQQTRCGFVQEPGDVDGVVNRILELRSNRELRARLGNNGREYAQAHFSLGACTAAYERLFDRVCSNRRSSGAPRADRARDHERGPASTRNGNPET